MKVNIGPYRNWFGPYQLAEKIMFWKDKDDDAVFDFGEKISNTFIGDFLQWVDSKKKRKVKVHIDKYDTWGMDHTLALIILPMLKQLRDTKHGSPAVDDKDVPKHLRCGVEPASADYEPDGKWHQRWEWVMDEMIWAFEQIVDDDNDSQFFDHSIEPNGFDVKGWKKHHKRINNGTRLFGVYYQGLWD